MEKIKLGQTGILVPTVSLGTWSFGGNSSSSPMAVGWAGQDDKNSQLALRKAYECGITHWDTADVYGDGQSEAVIGSIWKDIPREAIFLATKVGWNKGAYPMFYHPEQMKKNMERSLKNLKTDCVDLMYLHHCNFGKSDEMFDDALDIVRRFQEEGKTKFIGLSDWYLPKMMKYIERVNPDVVQPYRNVMDDSYASSGLKDWIDKNKAGVCFFSPLKHGLLTGKYTETPQFEKSDFRSTVQDFQNPDIIEKMQNNKNLLTERFPQNENPVMHGLVNALLTDAPTGCVLLGQRNEMQVQVASKLGKALSKEEANWVKALYKNG
ncbi:MAG: hypothetical protein HN657_05775 [Candidatus Marinimicrobia bacterium]|jgi:aryl-alcohol dehydrogenase-like predicted oxidoreductase|nr:hypothetical protein [Candidatus Neomarinimicrobiota bacterium]MBT3497174.1 hypothetical protein [Candidatus Neomarinimicrobiota bacterium]MBT3732563.1 hypothetical protein [Candidatus Neomarinimicrobiota bacterium]MBT4144940.1 hypothetical protein [Candidatus Neomarinimicrobiota bacterium]MBT4178069.1 hypothetical protein [Candidatus Neomarinimicrobiota bacterium]